jgi:hypothetical protein
MVKKERKRKKHKHTKHPQWLFPHKEIQHRKDRSRKEASTATCNNTGESHKAMNAEREQPDTEHRLHASTDVKLKATIE